MIRRVLTFDVVRGKTSQEAQALPGKVLALGNSLIKLYVIEGVLPADLRYGVLPASLKYLEGTVSERMMHDARSLALYFGFRDDETVARFGPHIIHQDWAKDFYRGLRTNHTFFQFESPESHSNLGVERLLTFNLAEGTPAHQVQEFRTSLQKLRLNPDVEYANLERLAGTVPPALKDTARYHGIVLRFRDIGAASRFDLDSRQFDLTEKLYAPLYKDQTFFQNAR